MCLAPLRFILEGVFHSTTPKNYNTAISLFLKVKRHSCLDHHSHTLAPNLPKRFTIVLNFSFLYILLDLPRSTNKEFVVIFFAKLKYQYDGLTEPKIDMSKV